MGVLTFSTVDWSVVASCSPVMPMYRRWASKLQSECGLRCLGNVCVRGVQDLGIFIYRFFDWEICSTTMSHTSKQSGMAGLTINKINYYSPCTSGSPSSSDWRATLSCVPTCKPLITASTIRGMSASVSGNVWELSVADLSATKRSPVGRPNGRLTVLVGMFVRSLLGTATCTRC